MNYVRDIQHRNKSFGAPCLFSYQLPINIHSISLHQPKGLQLSEWIQRDTETTTWFCWAGLSMGIDQLKCFGKEGNGE